MELSKIRNRRDWMRTLGGLALLLSSMSACDGDATTAGGDQADENSDSPADTSSSSTDAGRTTTTSSSGNHASKDGGAKSTAVASARDAGGTSSTGTGAPKAGEGSLWCQAKQALEARCTSCHDGNGTAGTPFGLTKSADLTAVAPGHPDKKVYERVGVRIHGEQSKAEGLGVMPPKNNATAEEIAALDAWIAAGAPGGDSETCAPAAAPAGTLGADGRPISIWDPTLCDDIYKITVHDGAGGKLKVPGSPLETYPKVDVDAPWGDEVVQIINTRPITDNGKVLHHWILYDKKGPFITGWAPGDNERRPLPDGVGMKVPSGKASLYLDMHYYNRTGTEQEDASGLEVCVVKGKNLRPNPAGVTMGWSQLSFSVPAGAKDYTVRGQCTVRAKQPIHVMTASPHAHKLAQRMVFSVVKANGSKQQMLDKPFVFGEQASYPLEQEVIVENGDRVITECIMTNATTAAVRFGESNDTEMCFNFASYYPVGGFCCEELGLESCLLNGSAGGLFGPQN
jgi:Copper type II ascorbate-dependent monooxygenase, C-terminal domain